MDVVNERCCGLDVHKQTVVACVIVPGNGRQPHKEVRTFGTMTADLLELADWLSACNVTHVAMESTGVYWKGILTALVAGTADPTLLADFARGKLRSKLPQLERALVGQFGSHQRFLLAQQLAHLDALDELIERLNAEVEDRLRPFEEALERLDTIPGVGRRIAEILVAEIGLDMTRFPTAAHLASWAGMRPGNNESAGKRKSGKTRKGDYLATSRPHRGRPRQQSSPEHLPRSAVPPAHHPTR